MKTRVITLAFIAIIFYACSEKNNKVNELDVITEQNDVDKNIITITEQEAWMETITEEEKFYKYKQLIEKLKNAKEQNGINKSVVISEVKDIEVINEQL